MLDMRSGRVSYAVLSFGGFLGMGQKLFAVPWEALELDTSEKRFVLNVEKGRLKDAPGFGPLAGHGRPVVGEGAPLLLRDEKRREKRGMEATGRRVEPCGGIAGPSRRS